MIEAMDAARQRLQAAATGFNAAVDVFASALAAVSTEYQTYARHRKRALSRVRHRIYQRVRYYKA